MRSRGATGTSGARLLPWFSVLQERWMELPWTVSSWSGQSGNRSARAVQFLNEKDS